MLVAGFLPGDSAIGLSAGTQELVAIEEGSNGYLSAWTDDRVTNSLADAQDIYGQLLDSSGAPTGPPVLIANVGRQQQRPDIAWNAAAQEWLVVFEGQNPDAFSNNDVYGVRVAADGTVVDEEPIRFFREIGSQGAYEPQVASDGTDWVVIIDQWYGEPVAQRTIFGKRLGGDGSIIDTNPKVLAQANLNFPDIAYADGTYMIAANNVDNENVLVRRVDTDLNPIGGVQLVGAGVYEGPSIASNGNDFFVVGGSSARRLNSSGQFVGASIPLGGTLNVSGGSAAWNGNEWVVGFGSANGVYAQRVATDGQVIDSTPILLDTVSVSGTFDVAGFAGNSVAVYTDRPGFDKEVRSALLMNDGTAMPPIDIAIGMARQRAVDVVDGPNGENLVVYTSEVGDDVRILSQRIHDDGTLIDQEPLLVQLLPGGYSAPKVAWNGSVYMVGWSNQVVRLSADNTLLDPAPITVPESIGAIAAAGDNFLVGLYNYEPFTQQPRQYMEFVRIRGTDGVLLDTTTHFVAGGFVRSMTAANFGDKAIFAWQQHNRHDNDSSYVESFIVDENAHWNGTFDAGGGKSPDIAVQENKALIVWGGGEIEGQFVNPDGSLSSFDFPISTQPLNEAAPDVAWVGNEFVVAWQDYRHQEEIQELRADIYTARVLDDGTVRDPRGIQISATDVHEHPPAVVGGNGDHWILYPRLHGVDGVEETQRIAYEYNPEIKYHLQPFERLVENGTLAAGSKNTLGVIAYPSDTHDYSLFVEAGERVTALITSVDPAVTFSAEVVGLSGVMAAPGPGQPLLIPLQTATSDGEVTLNINADGRSAYELAVYRNTNAEALLEQTAINLSDSAIGLADGVRYTAVGSATGQVGGTGFDHYNDPSAFIDISATGTRLLQYRTYVDTNIGNDVFPAGLTTIIHDGVITEGLNPNVQGFGEPLPNTLYLGFGAALAPYWTGLGDEIVYMEERLVNGVNALVVQWEGSDHFDGGDGKFQAHIYESGPVKIRYAYDDVTFGHADSDGGKRASIGVQIDGTTAHQFSYLESSLSDGDVLDFLDRPTIEDIDEFVVDLAAGEPVDIALTGVQESLAGARFELLDSSFNVLATGMDTLNGAGISNMDQGILAYTPTQSGTYTIRVGTDLTTEYSLEVTQSLTMDVEPSSSTLRSLDASGAALGLADALPALDGFTHFNDPTAFVDISDTGQPLFFTTEDGVTPINTSISNQLVPAGELLVANDGAVLLDHVVMSLDGAAQRALPTNWFTDVALLPMWMDFKDSSGSVLYEERWIDGIQTMIVQWNDVEYRWGGPDGATFQLQLFDQNHAAAAERFARFAYSDVDLGDPAHNAGANATIGVQLNQQTAVQFSHDTPQLGDGDVIDFALTQDDRYTLTLAAGESVTLRTQTPFDNPQRPLPNDLDPALAIYDPNGQLLAMDEDSAGDGRNALFDFVAPVAGSYIVGIYKQSGYGDYLFEVNRTTVLDPDFDDDGDYDIDDLDALSAAVVNSGPVVVYDLNGDGALDVSDVDSWRELAGDANLGIGLAYQPADANLDGVVDGTDFIRWNANKFSASPNWSDGDFNVDGVVDGQDFVIWNQYKFSSAFAYMARGDAENRDGDERRKLLVDEVFASFRLLLAGEHCKVSSP